LWPSTGSPDTTCARHVSQRNCWLCSSDRAPDPSAFRSYCTYTGGDAMIATFDPTAYKTTTRAQWDDAAGAWHAWGPTLEDWLGEATTLMLDAAGIHIGSAVLDVAAGAGGQTLDAARRVRQSPETVETRDWSFWILSRCRSCPGFRSLR
jgi:hypothetical protein